MKRKAAGGNATLSAVRDFWETHVNNEYYTRAERASEEYFSDIERRRYERHYHLRRLLQDFAGSSGRLLEVGCGIGVDSMQLSRAGFDVTGVDLTESAIEVARRFAEERALDVQFLLGNAEDLEFEDSSFDVVYSFGVLHHTPDIRRAISEVHRVLVSGGTAYVMLYHKRSLVNLIHRVFRLPYESPKDLKDQCPVVYTFNRPEAAELFNAFRDVRIESDYPFTYGFRYFTGWIPEGVQRWLGRRIGWHLMIRAVK